MHVTYGTRILQKMPCIAVHWTILLKLVCSSQQICYFECYEYICDKLENHKLSQGQDIRNFGTFELLIGWKLLRIGRMLRMGHRLIISIMHWLYQIRTLYIVTLFNQCTFFSICILQYIPAVYCIQQMTVTYGTILGDIDYYPTICCIHKILV